MNNFLLPTLYYYHDDGYYPGTCRVLLAVRYKNLRSGNCNAYY